jgi:hypothetical protein
LRLWLDIQLVAKRIERINVTKIQSLARGGARVACRIPNRSICQRLAGGVQNASQFSKNASPTVGLSV